MSDADHLDAGDLDAWLERWRLEAGELRWERPFDAVSTGDGPERRWFPGGELNAAVNCLDRHLPERADQVAIHWEGEPGDCRSLTYGELHAEVCAAAAGLAGLGVGFGDRVGLYVGLVPEAITAALACARLGAVHVIVPQALPVEALADRLALVRPKVLVTQDAAWRHGVLLPLKARADEALAAVGAVEGTVVLRRAGLDVTWYEGDVAWADLLSAGRARLAAGPGGADPVAVPSDHPLLVMQLANRPGHPTGIVHGTGGYLTAVSALHRQALTTAPDDVVFCAIEFSWAGQSQGVYGPLVSGGTTLLYEGMLDTPRRTRTWELVDRYAVHTFLTTPSVIRKLRSWGDAGPGELGLDSLRLVVTGGERLDGASSDWLVKEVTRGRAVVADGWGLLEQGGLVSVTPIPPDAAGPPDPGLDVVEPDGRPAPPAVTGDMVVRRPWPATFVALEGGRSPDEYWGRHPGLFATGDWARREADGTVVCLGRQDPMISVSGQLVSLAELADVLRDHPFVRAADVRRVETGEVPDIVAYVVLEDGVAGRDDVDAELVAHIHDTIGGLARPSRIVHVDALPAPGESR
ncbi:MAG TPA: AMP-binding protein [Acidimicrobiia bacterium]|nr:AMP-binding protein [Acidimicrobiia bacterium]